MISKTISLSSILEVSDVLKRKPLIWDNLHANDYDQRRLFLGPYVGRSPSLIPYLAGVLTNPNCEYTVNFIAIHTLAQWSKCSTKRTSQDVTDEEDLAASTNDDVEYMQSTICSSSSSERGSSPEQDQDVESERVYNPRRALDGALVEWIKEFGKPQKREKTSKVELSGKCLNDGLSEPPPLMGPPIAVGGATAERTSIVSTVTDEDEGDSPMELACEDQRGNPRKDETRTSTAHIERPDKTHVGPFTQEDLYVLVDFFYLPHKYGPLGVKMLQSFNWVKGNAPSQESLQKHKRVFEEVGEDLGQLDELQCDVDQKVRHGLCVCLRPCIRACMCIVNAQTVDRVLFFSPCTPHSLSPYSLLLRCWLGTERHSSLEASARRSVRCLHASQLCPTDLCSTTYTSTCGMLKRPLCCWTATLHG